MIVVCSAEPSQRIAWQQLCPPQATPQASARARGLSDLVQSSLVWLADAATLLGFVHSHPLMASFEPSRVLSVEMLSLFIDHALKPNPKVSTFMTPLLSVVRSLERAICACDFPNQTIGFQMRQTVPRKASQPAQQPQLQKQQPQPQPQQQQQQPPRQQQQQQQQQQQPQQQQQQQQQQPQQPQKQQQQQQPQQQPQGTNSTPTEPAPSKKKNKKQKQPADSTASPSAPPQDQQKTTQPTNTEPTKTKAKQSKAVETPQLQVQVPPPNLPKSQATKSTEPEILPIFEFEDEILKSVTNNIVTCVRGETGCGKSSMIPQFIYKEAIAAKRRVKIVVTQPRRIAATSLAQRVADQLGCAVGQTVGYHIGGESRVSSETKIEFVTTGYLLQLLCHRPEALQPITHLILDEAHERNIEGDMLCLVVKKLIHAHNSAVNSNAQRKRLVVMSATLQSGLFAQYFASLSSELVCPVIHVGVKRFAVDDVFLDDLAQGAVRIGLSGDERQMCDTLRKGFDNNIQKSAESAKKNKEAELTKSTEQSGKSIIGGEDLKLDGQGKLNRTHLRAQLVNFVQDHKQTELVFTANLSASDRMLIHQEAQKYGLKHKSEGKRDVDRFITVSKPNANNTTVNSDPPNREDVLLHTKSMGVKQEQLHKVRPDMPPDCFKLVSTLLLRLAEQCIGQNWSILVFLPGQSEIFSLMDTVEQMTQIHLVVLHSSVPYSEQAAAFEPAPLGKVKVVFATNIAESSITIPDVRFVVNLGLRRAMARDATMCTLSLVRRWCSLASNRQRAGRAGRLFPGTCFHIMSRKFFDLCLPEFDDPEMLEMPLENVVLKVRLLLAKLGTVKELLSQLPQPPPLTHVNVALQRLKDVGALLGSDENSEVTALGHLAVHLPIDIQATKLIALGITFSCIAPAIVLAATIGVGDIFTCPSRLFVTNPSAFANQLSDSFMARLKFDDNELSEGIGLMNAYASWLHTRRDTFRWPRLNSMSYFRLKQFDQSVIEIAERVFEFFDEERDQTQKLGSGFTDKTLRDIKTLMSRSASVAAATALEEVDNHLCKFLLCAAFSPLFAVGTKQPFAAKLGKAVQAATFNITGNASTKPTEALPGIVALCNPPGGITNQQFNALISNIVSEEPQLAVVDHAARIAILQYPPQQPNTSLGLQDFPDAIKLLSQFSEGRANKLILPVVQQHHRDADSFERQPDLLFKGIASEMLLGWRSASNSRTFIRPNYRGTVGFIGDCVAAERQIIAVVSSIIGTESPTMVRAVGFTVLPTQRRFAATSVFISLPPSTTVKMCVSTDRQFCRAFRISGSDAATPIVFNPPLTAKELEICNAMRRILDSTVFELSADPTSARQVYEAFLELCNVVDTNNESSTSWEWVTWTAPTTQTPPSPFQSASTWHVLPPISFPAPTPTNKTDVVRTKPKEKGAKRSKVRVGDALRMLVKDLHGLDIEDIYRSEDDDDDDDGEWSDGWKTTDSEAGDSVGKD